MIIFPIDDVYDLKVGRTVRYEKTRKRLRQKVNGIYRRGSTICIVPILTVNGVAFFRNGFAYYECYQINEYMMKPPIPQMVPRLKI